MHQRYLPSMDSVQGQVEGGWGGRLKLKFCSGREGRAPQQRFKAFGRVSSQALQGSSCHRVTELGLNRSSSSPS